MGGYGCRSSDSSIPVRACVCYQHFTLPFIFQVVNVEVLPLAFNLALLGGAAAFLIHDVVTFDYAALVYLAKTFSGDFLAGKLDTTGIASH